MKIRNKIRLRIKFIVSMAVDSVLISFWASLSWVIHEKVLPWFELTGTHGAIINFIALVFEIVTAILCLIYIAIDMKGEINEYRKNR